MSPQPEFLAELPQSTAVKRAISPAKTPRSTSPDRSGAQVSLLSGETLKVGVSSGSNLDQRLRNRGRPGDNGRPAPLNVEAVDNALRHMQRPHRESTPSSSPSRKRQRINADRCVCRLLILVSHRRLISSRVASFPVVLVKISRQVLVFFTRTAHQLRRLQDIRSVRRMVNFTSKRVSFCLFGLREFG